VREGARASERREKEREMRRMREGERERRREREGEIEGEKEGAHMSERGVSGVEGEHARGRERGSKQKKTTKKKIYTVNVWTIKPRRNHMHLKKLRIVLRKIKQICLACLSLNMGFQ